MVSRERFADSFDVNTPSVARMYDYILGGTNNFGADREAAEQALASGPEIRALAHENRAFLQRAVRFLVETCGIRQFLDIGAGLPTQGNVHEVAQRIAPQSHVVYVDNDPSVVAYSSELLSGVGGVRVIQGDLREPDNILANPRLRFLIDFNLPVAVLFVSVLQFVANNERPEEIVGRFRDVMAPGSYLAISHGTGENYPPEVVEQATRAWDRTTSPMTLRTPDELTSLFAGFEIVDPGLVFLPQWRPDVPDVDPSSESLGAGRAAVGRRV